MSEEMDCLNRLFDFALRRPDVGEIDRLAVFAFAERIFAQINIDASGQRESHHQRRRHQIVGAHFGVDAAFEVAIAARAPKRRPDSFSSMACETSVGSGPELPMQVVHPYPTI